MSQELSLETEKTKLERKLAKRIGPRSAEELVAKLQNSSKEELEEQLLDLSKTLQGIINTKNADEILNGLKSQVREHSRKYNDQTRGNKELTRLVSLIISEQYGDELMDRKTTDDTQENEE